MEQLIPVLMIVGFVVFIMSKQINRVTRNIADNEVSSHEGYSRFSVTVQEEIRAIKNGLDSSKTNQDSPYKLLEGKDEALALETLSNYIRKLVFFETMMAKQKSPDEIEADLFEILNGVEQFLIENCEDGEKLSEELRERLLAAYEQI